MPVKQTSHTLFRKVTDGALKLRAFNAIGGRFDYILAFIPGLLFIALACTLIIAPELVLGVIAGIFLSLGLLACFGAWKIIQMKRRIEKMAQQLKGRLVIQGMSVQPDLFSMQVEEITKKTIFH